MTTHLHDLHVHPTWRRAFVMDPYPDIWSVPSVCAIISEFVTGVPAFQHYVSSLSAVSKGARAALTTPMPDGKLRVPVPVKMCGSTSRHGAPWWLRTPRQLWARVVAADSRGVRVWKTLAVQYDVLLHVGVPLPTGNRCPAKTLFCLAQTRDCKRVVFVFTRRDDVGDPTRVQPTWSLTQVHKVSTEPRLQRVDSAALAGVEIPAPDAGMIVWNVTTALTSTSGTAASSACFVGERQLWLPCAVTATATSAADETVSLRVIQYAWATPGNVAYW